MKKKNSERIEKKNIFDGNKKPLIFPSLSFHKAHVFPPTSALHKICKKNQFHLANKSFP